MRVVQRLMSSEEGQGLVEYGLIIGLISLIAILALTAMGGSVSGMFGSISSKMGAMDSSIAAGAGS
jgi:pilus assembly protein Flp/PilA